MPDQSKCTCVPLSIRAAQRVCHHAQIELQTVEDRLEAARHGVLLPAHSEAVFNGDKPPTVETEVYGGLCVLLDDHIPEMRQILQEVSIATPRRVSTAWNRLQRSIRRAKAEARNRDTAPGNTDSHTDTPTTDVPESIES